MGARMAAGIAGALLLALVAAALWPSGDDAPPRRDVPAAERPVAQPPAPTPPQAAAVPAPGASPAPGAPAEREGVSPGRAQPAPPPPVPAELRPLPREERTLARARVDAALAREARLDRQLRTTRTVHDGHRLLKLGVVEPESFYAELGFESRDVLMLVDDQWVTDRANPLWEALRSRDELVLVVMRRGTPRAWRVRIEPGPGG